MDRILKRRAFLAGIAGGALLALPRSARTEDDASRKHTYTYKTVGDCEIKADVYDAARGAVRPVVIWIHGGALIMGNRGGMDGVLRAKLIDAGYTVVSVDYRLAPETKLPEILEDLQDACRWVREKGPELFHADAGRIAVMGASAGGYLTLASGFRVDPRPLALVSLWGYGDVAGPWYSRPDPFYRTRPLVPKEEADQAVGGAILSDDSGKKNRGRFYLYCRQQGLWPKEVAGHDPDTEPRAFDPFCPIRNVSRQYPPTLLVHGTNDTDVPYAQSEDMDRALARQGVDHELITVTGGAHGLAGSKPETISKIHGRILEFLHKYMR